MLCCVNAMIDATEISDTDDRQAIDTVYPQTDEDGPPPDMDDPSEVEKGRTSSRAITLATPEFRDNFQQTPYSLQLYRKVRKFYEDLSVVYIPESFSHFLIASRLEKIFMMRLVFAWRFSAYLILTKVNSEPAYSFYHSNNAHTKQREPSSKKSNRHIFYDRDHSKALMSSSATLDLFVDTDVSSRVPLDTYLLDVVLQQCPKFFANLTSEEQVRNFTLYQMFRRLFNTPLLLIQIYATSHRGHITVQDFYDIVKETCKYSLMRVDELDYKMSIAHSSRAAFGEENDNPVNTIVKGTFTTQGWIQFEGYNSFDNIDDVRDDVSFQNMSIRQQYSLNELESYDYHSSFIFQEFDYLIGDSRFFTDGELLSKKAYFQSIKIEEVSDDEGTIMHTSLIAYKGNDSWNFLSNIIYFLNPINALSYLWKGFYRKK